MRPLVCVYTDYVRDKRPKITQVDDQRTCTFRFWPPSTKPAPHFHLDLKTHKFYSTRRNIPMTAVVPVCTPTYNTFHVIQRINAVQTLLERFDVPGGSCLAARSAFTSHHCTVEFTCQIFCFRVVKEKRKNYLHLVDYNAEAMSWLLCLVKLSSLRLS